MEYHEKRKKTEALPILKKSNEIIQTIANNRVTVITGDTGCGKTTQVPQFILNYCEKNQLRCNLICTQPRRIAAITIARRVANELNCELGGEVGYQVRMRSRLSNNTKIQFVTTGILLQRLIHETKLDAYTHVILDEIHERDLNSDFCLVMIKHLLSKSNPNVKLILMSATFDTRLFANYFSASSIAKISVESNIQEEVKVIEQPIDDNNQWNEWTQDANIVPEKSNFTEELVKDAAPVVGIECKRYNVKMYYIDDLVKLDSRMGSLTKSISNEFNVKRPKYLSECVNIAKHIIIDIIHKSNFLNDITSLKKTILVFVPGYAEIIELIDTLYNYDRETVSSSICLIPVHSTIPEDEQDKMFEPSSLKIRKIIIATNIAESSITIPDVECILDFCLVKENSFNSLCMCERLTLSWASKANLMQRSGRTGRVGDGFAFRLVPYKFYESMRPYSSPEMLRCQLDKLILQIKTWNYLEPQVILNTAIQPPKIQEIMLAIERLKDMGALTRDDKKPKITYIGNILCELPCDIKSGKMIIYSGMFGCTKQALILAGIYQQEKAVFRCRNEITKRYIASTQYYGLATESDDIMLLQVYDDWQKQFGYGNGYRRPIKDEEYNFCKKNNLNARVLHEINHALNEMQDRLLYMSFSKEMLASSQPYNSKGVLILKLWLAACYCPKFLKPFYDGREKIIKTIKKIEERYPKKAHNVICFNDFQGKEFLTDKLKNEIKDFAQPISFDIYGSHLVVLFDGERSNHRKGIMGIMKYVRSYNNTQRLMDINLKSSHPQPMDDAELPHLHPESPYEVKFVDCIDRTVIHIETSSVMYSEFIPFNEPLSDIVYIAKDFIDKKGGKYCRSITKIGGFANISALLFIIFSPVVKIRASGSNTMFDSVDALWYKTCYNQQLSHILSTLDISEANQIRHAMSTYLTTDAYMNGTIKDSVNIPDVILKFLDAKRVALRKPTRFDKYLEMKYMLKPITPCAATKEDKELFPPVQFDTINEDTRIYTKEGIEEIIKQRKDIELYKSRIIEELEREKKLLQTNECEVICNVCNISICPISCTKIEDDGFGGKMLILNCTFGLGYFKSMDKTMGDAHSHFNNIENCLGCPNMHPVALEVIIKATNKKVIIVTTKCPVKLIMPDLSLVPIKEEDLLTNFKEIKETAGLMVYSKSGTLSVKCKICDEDVAKTALTKHMKSNCHKMNFEEFKEC